MARIRSIKPEFWTNERVLSCSTNARLLFIGMWNFADDKGRIPFSPKMLKAQIFPGDDFVPGDIAGMIGELSTNGLVSSYFVDEKGYLEILGWAHQKIDRPQPAKYPEPSESNRRMVSTDLILSEGKGSERKKDGADAPIVNLFPKNTDPPSEEKSYFDRFKEICGPKAGGLAVKLKNHMLAKGKPLSAARAALETASSTSDPKEYIGGILRGHGTNSPNGRPPDKPGMVWGDDYM